jgi:hypothetical protein
MNNKYRFIYDWTNANETHGVRIQWEKEFESDQESYRYFDSQPAANRGHFWKLIGDKWHMFCQELLCEGNPWAEVLDMEYICVFTDDMVLKTFQTLDVEDEEEALIYFNKLEKDRPDSCQNIYHKTEPVEESDEVKKLVLSINKKLETAIGVPTQEWLERG